MSERKTIMHLDGCHFFVWVWRENGDVMLSVMERRDSDLAVHGQSDCDRCRELGRRGGGFHAVVTLDDEPPTDAKDLLFWVMAEIATRYDANTGRPPAAEEQR